MNEQIARDAKITRIHAEEELQIMIDGLDRNNETVANAQIPDSAKKTSHKEAAERVLHFSTEELGWMEGHFKGMTLKEIKEKFDSVWKKIQDFDPIGSKEEAERFKRKGLRLEQESVKKL
nr:hypothetical protein [Tanacetum cinerariifolium]